MKNVAGVFRVRRVPREARHILLVDDTFTTGATLAACYNALREVLDPSQRISVATLAVVQD
jgi:predicted amidophosphoribosyltransferase